MLEGILEDIHIIIQSCTNSSVVSCLLFQEDDGVIHGVVGRLPVVGVVGGVLVVVVVLRDRTLMSACL